MAPLVAVHSQARVAPPARPSLAGGRPAAAVARRTLPDQPRRRADIVPRAAGQRKEADATQESAAEEEKPEGKAGPKIDFVGVKQLIMMGMGTIAGDITEINLNDPARTVVMELEANNFEDADGKPINYIQDKGYVDDAAKEFKPLNLLLPLVLGAATLGGVAATLKALS
eukprot:jgi/Tetstr1/444834/TSEL_032676.t1